MFTYYSFFIIYSSFLGFKIIIIVCLFYFIYDCYQLMKGKKSVNYYCWSLFIYRVQLLNTLNVRPVYYSTSFIRYFKAAQIIHYLRDEKNSKVWKPEAAKLSLNDDEINKLIDDLFKGFKVDRSISEIIKNQFLGDLKDRKRRFLKFCRKKIQKK